MSITESQMTSSNVLFFLTNSLKPKYSVYFDIKQQILILETLTKLLYLSNHFSSN